MFGLFYVHLDVFFFTSSSSSASEICFGAPLRELLVILYDCVAFFFLLFFSFFYTYRQTKAPLIIFHFEGDGGAEAARQLHQECAQLRR